MKSILLLSAFVSVVLTAPQYSPIPPQPIPEQFIPILAQSHESNPDGSYLFSYQTGNGIFAQEQGYRKNPAVPDEDAEVVQGFVSYTSPEGIPIEYRYYADETGFHAEGAHLPTSPPIPEAIARALQLIPLQSQEPQALQTYRS